MLSQRAAFALALGLALTGGPARAEDLLVPQGTMPIPVVSGNHLYGKVTIDGTVQVKAYDAKVAGTGWLWIRAREISVGPNGIIDARGIGYRGAKSGAEGFKLGAGGTPMTNPGDATPYPGGGGAHFGKGGSGVDGSCMLVASADGGVAYDDSMTPLALMAPEQGMGSAGGTSHAGAPEPDQDVAGGNGGGVVILEAATITLLGAIRADGAAPQALFKSSPGGGAGGTIYVLANNFSSGDQTLLTATGAKGGTGSSPNGGRGGGSGGGGMVVLVVKNPPPADKISVVGGGTTLGACDPPKGGAGAYQTLDPKACVDADRDGSGSAACGGKDCDDANELIKPGQKEACNGIDDDCSGKIDDAPDDAMCAKNQVCANGQCRDKAVAPPTVSSAGDPRIQLHGGLCAFAPTSRPGGAVLALFVGVALLVRRKQGTRNRKPESGIRKCRKACALRISGFRFEFLVLCSSSLRQRDRHAIAVIHPRTGIGC